MSATSPTDRVFAALSDPTRRDVLERIGAAGEASATQLARDLPISRQAIAKHLAVLSGAGLVESFNVGREIRYRALGARLSMLANELESIGREWDRRLAAIKRIAETN